MGACYFKYSRLYPEVFDQDDVCILEIGSEHGEGSTKFFHQLSKDFDVPFYTVDVKPEIAEHLERNEILGSNCSFYSCGGEVFLKEHFSNFDKKIAVLYLDNFDWIWCPEDFYRNSYQDENNHMRKQIDEYISRGIDMTPVNSSNAHLLQTVLALPYLASKSVVILDDTWFDSNEHVYVGKGGPSVHYLMIHGWKIERDPRHPPYQCGVVMKNFS